MTSNLKVYIYTICTTILITGIICGLTWFTNQATAIPNTGNLQAKPLDPNIENSLTLLPRIKITTGYAMEGCQTNGICHPFKTIIPGDKVYEGQKIQFRVDFITPPVTPLGVHCAIDGVDKTSQCKKLFDGKGYQLTLPTDSLKVRSYPQFSVYIDTNDGKTNTPTFKFFYTRAVPID